jgi:hypothetical protein
LLQLYYYTDTEKIKMVYEFECNDCGARLYLSYDRVSPSGKRIPLEVQTREPHNCPQREFTYESDPFPCKDCGVEIYVTDERLSKNSKRIPINEANDESHQCVNRRNNFSCKMCKAQIYLDPSRTSKSGRRIPLDAVDGLPHQCPQKAKDTFGLKTMLG